MSNLDPDTNVNMSVSDAQNLFLALEKNILFCKDAAQKYVHELPESSSTAYLHSPARWTPSAKNKPLLTHEAVRVSLRKLDASA